MIHQFLALSKEISLFINFIIFIHKINFSITIVNESKVFGDCL